MECSHETEIEAPAEAVFAVLSDLDLAEAMLGERGAEVERTDTLEAPGKGMSWRVEADVGGRQRSFAVRLTRYDPPSSLTLAAAASGIEAIADATVTPLAAGRSRLRVDLVLEPRSIAGRLLLQSLRLGGTRTIGRIDRGLGRFAGYVARRAEAA